ncbi:CU044_2847 family protein [Nocardia sp. NPDC005998]|uniref:CU044_2847 family protein n=1 Tax=Nocardia sp. NPDC005998 TaxID=3156894 RepID=UPI0033A7B7F7
MSELLRFRTGDGGVIVVEGDPSDAGVQRVGRGGVVEVNRRFEDALADVQRAAAAALAVFRDGSLKPDAVDLEFGIKLNAEAGAVIAKTSVEGHLTVKLSWKPGT